MRSEFAVKNWLKDCSVLWDTSITPVLIHENKISDNTTEGYSISKCIDGDYDSKRLIPISSTHDSIFLELPAASIKSFYKSHGLEPVCFSQGEEKTALRQINSALLLLKSVVTIYKDILQLVKTIQIIRSETAETDVSYSHPEIPFSIFMSLVDDTSMISNLRIAESIIHESMHLKLTLIENLVPLVIPGSTAIYYSPWRKEERPIRGVLHGLFVFKVILEFYKIFASKTTTKNVTEYLSVRQADINLEIKQLSGFFKSPGLTEEGKDLAFKLL
jgi:HEXXH motif-containing protein